MLASPRPRGGVRTARHLERTNPNEGERGKVGTVMKLRHPTMWGTWLAALAVGCGDAPTIPLVTTPAQSDAVPLTISPSPLRLPTVQLGCRGSRAELVLTNRSAGTVRIPSATLNDPSAAFTADLPATPFELGPLQQRSVPVRFLPDRTGTFTAQLTFEIAIDGGSTRVVELSGTALDARQIEETFQQLPSLATDVVFVVDNSSSMRAEQEALRNNFQAFVREANAGFSDYRVAVTTTDMTQEAGRFVPVSNGTDLDGDGIPDDLDGDGDADDDDLRIERNRALDRFIDRSSQPTPAFAFRRLANVGAFGDAEEQGMEAMLRALSPELREASNAFFFRDDALLSIIFVSDEDDQSPESIDFYSEAFEALAPSGRVRVSAVTGPTPDGCTLGTERAVPAFRYEALARRFDGAFSSICTSNWSQTLEQVSGLAFGLRVAFELSGIPDGPIQLWVDGSSRPEVLPSGARLWSYDAELNEIRFEDLAIPGLGSEIRVRYDLSCPNP